MKIHKNGKLVKTKVNGKEYLISNNSNYKSEYINLTPSDIILNIGDTVQLNANFFINEENKKLIWKSYNEAIATVNENGLVTALAEGGITITCYSEVKPYISDVCEILIKANETIEPIVENKFTYISTYNVEPKVDVNEDVIINYYVTDYEQKEYILNDYSENFSVDYWIDDVKQPTISNVSAGDNEINLGKLSNGEKVIGIQATDSKGNKSHVLYKRFWVLDKTLDEADILAKTYNVTDSDLNTFGIKKDFTNPIETTNGINNLIIWAKTNNYRKIAIPTGNYLISKDSTILISVDNLILDLNGSIFKLETNNYDSAMIVRIANASNSHVINGTIEGDLETHIYGDTGSTIDDGTDEWVHAVEIGGSEYCTFDNITLKNIVGYGSTTNNRTVEQYLTTGEAISGWRNVDIENGIEIESFDNVTSSKYSLIRRRVVDNKLMADCTRETGTGWVQFGMPIGFQGNITGNQWLYKMNFYSGNVWLTTILSHAYRQVRVPVGATHVSVTLFASDPISIGASTLGYVRFPLNGGFKNVRHENIRCCGTALCATSNFVMENCSWDHCGWQQADCAFNTEDGWDLTQDLTLRGNEFIYDSTDKSPDGLFQVRGRGALTCSGDNIIMENNSKNFGYYIYSRTRNIVIRNNKITTQSFLNYDSVFRSGYRRIYNNDYYITSELSNSKDDSKQVIRDCTINGYSFTPKTHNSNSIVEIYNTIFNNVIENSIGSMLDFNYYNCTFSNFNAYLGKNLNFYDCYFNDNTIIKPNTKDLPMYTFNNCSFTGDSKIDGSLIYGNFNDCNFNKFTFNTIATNTIDNQLTFNTCIINSYNTDTDYFMRYRGGYINLLNCKLNDYTKYGLVEIGGTGAKQAVINIEDCAINKTRGYICGFSNPPSTITSSDCTVNIKNSPYTVSDLNSYAQGLINVNKS